MMHKRDLRKFIKKITPAQRRKIILVAIAVLAIIIALLALRAWEKQRNAASETEEGQELVYYNDQWYAYNDDMKTILLVGLDRFENNALTGDDVQINNMQSDFLLLLAVDTKSETVQAIHINRDTMTDIKIIGALGDYLGTEVAQLALSFTYGSGSTDSLHHTEYAVSNLMYNIPIDQSMAVTMEAVPIVNDAVGGVTVEVLHDFNGVDGIGNAGTTITLMGDQSLTYVRERGDIEANTNLERMDRQRQYMDALYAKLKQCAADDPDFVKNTIKQVVDYLITDSTTSQLEYAGKKLLNYTYKGITSTQGIAMKGDVYMEYYTDEEALAQLVIETFYQPVEE